MPVTRTRSTASFLRCFTSTRRRFAVAALLVSLALGASTPARAQLAVAPEGVSVAVPQDETATRAVTLTNTGSEPLTFCLSFDRP